MADHQLELSGQPPLKKLKSSAAPKGTKLAQGYQDRTLLRRAGDNRGNTTDDKEQRCQALEEMLKLQQIDQSTFEKLRGEIGIGGDLNTTHLVKGLDWTLLERVKKGERLEAPSSGTRTTDDLSESNVDEELEQALAKEVQGIQREERVKKGEMAPPPAKDYPASHRLCRDEILRQLKASRASNGPPSPTVAAELTLGPRFKKVDSSNKSQKKRFTEVVHGRRREVLIITDRDGKTKRKTRWLGPEDGQASSAATAEGRQQPLGMEVPAEMAAKQRAHLEQQQAAEEDEDIFESVGADYDPLADLQDSSEDESQTAGPEAAAGSATKPTGDGDGNPGSTRRNYFGTPDEDSEVDQPGALAQDATMLATLQRAAALHASRDFAHGAGAEDGGGGEARRQRFLEKVQQGEREDALGMDAGFGGSRFGDDDDEEAGAGVAKRGRKRGRRKRADDKGE